MSRAAKATPPADAHGQPVEPGALYEAVDGFVAEVAPGRELSARRGEQALGSADVVQRYGFRFKRTGTASPPPAFTTTTGDGAPYQPPVPPKPSPDDFVICTRAVAAPTGGVFTVIGTGERAPKSHPAVALFASCFRPLTDAEQADLAAVLDAA